MLKKLLSLAAAAAMLSAAVSVSADEIEWTIADPWSPGVIDFSTPRLAEDGSTIKGSFLNTNIEQKYVSDNAANVTYYNNQLENYFYLNPRNSNGNFVVGNEANDEAHGACLGAKHVSGKTAVMYYNFPSEISDSTNQFNHSGANANANYTGKAVYEMDLKLVKDTAEDADNTPVFGLYFISGATTHTSSLSAGTTQLKQQIYEMSADVMEGNSDRFILKSMPADAATNYKKTAYVTLTENGLPYDKWVKVKVELNYITKKVRCSITADGEPAAVTEIGMREGQNIKYELDEIKIVRENKAGATFFVDNVNLTVDKTPMTAAPAISMSEDGTGYIAAATVRNEWNGGAAKTPHLIFASYNADGDLTGCTAAAAGTIEKNTDSILQTGVLVPQQGDKVLRAFLWTNEGLRPYAQCAVEALEDNLE